MGRLTVARVSRVTALTDVCAALVLALVLALFFALVLVLTACSGATPGLGRGACPYMRPRILRLDAALATGNTATIAALDQDLGQYVKTNLPDGGKRKSDQPVVILSTALHGPVAGIPAAEVPIKHECAKPGAS